jgi:hypothetical protein
MSRRLPVIVLLSLVATFTACSPRRGRDELSQARAEAEEAKAALAKLQGEIKAAEAAATKRDPSRSGLFALETLDGAEGLLTGLSGNGFEGDRVYVFRYAGRGVPHCWLADEKGKTELGPVPSAVDVKHVIESNRRVKLDPVNQGFVALSLRGGKARLVVTVHPRDAGVGITRHAEGEFPVRDPKAAGITAGGMIKRDNVEAGKAIRLLERDGRALWLHFHPGTVPAADKQ